MFLSVIIPTYNRRELVTSAINSAIKQEGPPAEIIVVDDGSKDGTREQLEKEFGTRINYLFQQNAGEGAARNTGIAAASGDFYLFLDSDDRLAPGALAALFDANTKAREISILYGRTRSINEANEVLDRWNFCPGKSGNILESIIHGRMPSVGSFAVPRTASDRVGPFSKRIFAADWEYLVKLAKDYPFTFVDHEIAHHRDHSEERVYADRIKHMVADRIDILKDIFGQDFSSIQKQYLKREVIADWHRSAAFTCDAGGERQTAMSLVRQSLAAYPFQPKLYLWYINKLICSKSTK